MMDERYEEGYVEMQDGEFTYFEDVPDDMHDKYPYMGSYKEACEGHRIALVRDRHGKWGYLKEDGDMLIKCDYDTKEEAQNALHHFSSNIAQL